MKILFFTELSHAGGVDTFLAALISQWPHQDDHIVLLTNKTHPGLSNLIVSLKNRAEVDSHGIPVFADWVVARRERGLDYLRFASPLLRIFFGVSSFIRFLDLFKKIDADRFVVVAGGYPGGDSCRPAALAWRYIFGKKQRAILNFHNLAVPIRWWQFFEKGIDWLMSKSISEFIAVSKSCAMSMSVRPSIWKSQKCTHIFNGILPPVFDITPNNFRHEFEIKPCCPVVVMLATYEPRKGHLFFLNAFSIVLKTIPSAKAIFCGYGYPDEISAVRNRIDELGLKDSVLLVGFRQDAQQILAAADVLAVPTQAYESFGLVAAEAMSLGVPVVATDIGGLPEVIKDGEGGYIVPHQDFDKFARRLVELLSDSELRQAQGALGKARYFKLFTASRMASEYAKRIRNTHQLRNKPPLASER